MNLSDAVQGVGTELMPTSATALALFGLLYLLYEWLLPKPYPGIPYDPKSARKLLGDAPEMIREVGLTREVHAWLLKKVTELQEPLCQIFVQPFSKPFIVLADSVEAQNVMTRRPEFERSDFDRTSLSALDGFHSRHHMGDVWKRTRNWLQDLLSPGFLNNTVSPILYESSLLLVSYWEKKARLANNLPFDTNEDLDHFALDGMMSFVFDEEFRHAGLNPQNEAVAKMDPSNIKKGRNGEALFPHVKLNRFAEAMYGTVDVINATTATFFPSLGQYYVRRRPRFSKAIAVRRQVIEEQVQAAIKRFEATGEPKTAIEFMLMREKKAAEKQGRKPDYTNKVLRDEVRLRVFFTTSLCMTFSFYSLANFGYPVQSDWRPIPRRVSYVKLNTILDIGPPDPCLGHPSQAAGRRPHGLQHRPCGTAGSLTSRAGQDPGALRRRSDR